MSLDQVFKHQSPGPQGFKFNQSVANVFDNMLVRSIPFYEEIHNILIDILGQSTPPEVIYDLGCSTGNTLQHIDLFLRRRPHTIAPQYYAVDSSAPMLAKCQEKLSAFSMNVHYSQSRLEDLDFTSHQVSILNYTLQFLPLENRIPFLKSLYQALTPGGFLFLTEKVVAAAPFEEMFTDLYYSFKKRQGYSEIEIARKREALENVLIPLTCDEQVEMLRAVGFQKIDIVFKRYNFACFLAIK